MPEKNLQQEERLIAVVLLETYSESFKPFSSKIAECLLPLTGGKTMLDSNIEYLVDNNVEEIFLFCTNHFQQIKEYLDKKVTKKQNVQIHLHNIKCQSLGDAMREIDTKRLVTQNFILLSASSIISNIKLKDYLERHKTISTIDKDTILTIICEDRSNDLSFNFNSNDPYFMHRQNTSIIHNNNRLIYYDNLQMNSIEKKSKSKSYLSIPTKSFNKACLSSKQMPISGGTEVGKLQNSSQKSKLGIQSNSVIKMEMINHLRSIQQRNDLIETQIYLCSPYVLHVFTDNFDYQTMADLICGVLDIEEVKGYAIYIDIIKKSFGSYFSVINNLKSYYFESLRLLQRIDLILNEKEKSLFTPMSHKVNVFLSNESVKLGQNIKIERNVLIDSNTLIDDNTELTNCLIGSNCSIGKNVKLSNCIIWSNSSVGDNTILNAVLLGKSVKIGSDCKICENCLFSNECNVKDKSNINVRGVFVVHKEKNSIDKKLANINIKKESNLNVNEDNYIRYNLNNKNDDENSSDEHEFESDNDEDFPNKHNNDFEDNVSSIGSLNKDQLNINDTSLNSHFLVWKTKSKKSNIECKLLKDSNFDSDRDYEDNFSDASLTSSDESNISDNPVDDIEIFYDETVEILKRSFNQDLNPADIILEINSCRHAQAVHNDDFCYYVAKAIFNMPLIVYSKIILSKDAASKEKFDYLNIMKAQTSKTSHLFKNYYTKTKQSQKCFLNSLWDFFIETKPIQIQNTKINLLDTYFVKLIHYLYNEMEFLSEDVINEWYNIKKTIDFTIQSDINEKIKATVKKLEPFINWMNESEEEDEDE